MTSHIDDKNGSSQATAQHTFDVFDTSICRLVHTPEHLHLSVGRKLRHRGVLDLSDTEWLYARADAEFQQRLTVPHREITLDDIYGRLARSLNLTPDAARIAMETEFSEELRLIRPIASIQKRVGQLAAEGTPALFLSDTYLSSSQVASLLGRAGYREPLHVVASCERRKSKIAGTLFDHVANQRGIPASSFRHVGDNAASDVANARANGWDATLFSDSHWSARERVLFASGEGDFLASAIAGSARAARLGQDGPVQEGVATAAATVVGPLFAAFVLWILRDVLDRGGRTIHFLARDGQIMAQMCQRLARWLGVDIDARYTMASRQAFLLAALPDVDDDRMVDEALTLSYYDRITLSDALACLQYSADEIAAVTRQAGVDPSTTRSETTATEISSVREALRRADLLTALHMRVTTARAATLAYLESEGMFTSAEASIVDLGWRGTTQLRLQKVVGDRVDLVGYYLGLTNTVLGPDARTRAWTKTINIKTALLEVMAAADHTSVKGFGFDEHGKPICVPPVAVDPNLVRWGAREQQEIALRFVEYLTAAVELDHYSVDEVYAALKNAGLAAYRHFRLAPTRAEAEAYGGILIAADVNHVQHRELAKAITSMDVAHHVLDSASRGAATSWYTGSLARSQGRLVPTIIHRSIERTMLLQARIQTRRRRLAAYRSAEASLGARSTGSRAAELQ